MIGGQITYPANCKKVRIGSVLGAGDRFMSFWRDGSANMDEWEKIPDCWIGMPAWSEFMFIRKKNK